MKNEKTKKENLQKSVLTKDKQEREIYTVIWTMIGLLIVFVVFYYAFESMKTFEYEGLTFSKEKFGEIPVFHYYYYFTDDNRQQYKYNLYLRSDPRKNGVPITGNIIYPKQSFVFLSVNSTNLIQCPNFLRDYSALTSFLINNLEKSGIGIKDGFANKEEAEKNNLTHISCEKYPNNVVILLQSGNETKIEKN